MAFLALLVVAGVAGAEQHRAVGSLVRPAAVRVLPAPASFSVRQRAPALEPAVNFTGTWRLARQENFDEFLRSAGVPWPLRRLASVDRPRMVIRHDGGRFVWQHREAKKTQVIDAVIGSGVTVSCRSPMGEPMSVTFEWANAASDTDHDETPTRLYEEQMNLRSPSRSVCGVRWVEKRADGESEELVHELQLPSGAWTRRYYTREA